MANPRTSCCIRAVAKMDLLAFIYHADPTKVRIGDREVREGEGVGDDDVNEESGDAAMADQDEVPASIAERAKWSQKKRKVTGGTSGSSLPPKKLRADHGTFGAGASTSGNLLLHFRAYWNATPCLLWSEREGDGHTNSATGPDMRTQHPAKRSLVLDPSIMTTDFATTVVDDISFVSVPRAGDELVHASILGISPPLMDFETLQQIYVPKWDMVNDYALDDVEICHSIVDQLAPHIFFSQLCSIDYEQLFAEFNVGAARQTCLSTKEKDVEIASLKADLSLKEAEAAEAICLRGQVSVVKAAEAARVAELNDLKGQTTALEGHVAAPLKEQVAALESAVIIKDTELVSSNAQIAKLTQVLSNFQQTCDELSIKDASLESKNDKLTDQVFMLETTCSELRDEVSGYNLFKEQIKAVHDEQVKVLSYKVAAADIDHGKAGKGLVDVAAYDPSAEAHFVSVVNALLVVDFPIFAQLASQKDASVTDIMGLLNLEGPAAETPEAEQLQPSPEQIMLHIHCPEDQVVNGETSLSFSLDVVYSCVRRIHGDVASQRLSISEVMIPLIEPLSAENLVGEASTLGVPALITTTALSTTFVQTGSVPLVSVTDYEVSGAGPSTGVPSPPKIMFEKEELETTPEHTTVD
ncbi:hypothetical protein Tco_0039052 [Tanacetum coccineum]